MERLRPFSVSSFLTLALDASWYGVLVWLALAACLVIYSLGGDLSSATIDIPVWFGVEAPAIQVASPYGVPIKVELEGARGGGRMKFTPPPSRLFALFTTGGLLVALTLAAWTLWQLRAVFRTVRDGRPFVAANAVRIRRIGYTVIAAELARDVLVLAMGNFMTFRISADGFAFTRSPQVNLPVILAGVIIVAIGEVFREGTRLDEEQSLTI